MLVTSPTATALATTPVPELPWTDWQVRVCSHRKSSRTLGGRRTWLPSMPPSSPAQHTGPTCSTRTCRVAAWGLSSSGTPGGAGPRWLPSSLWSCPSAERRAEQLADDLRRVREEAKLLPLRQSALLRKEASAIAQDVVDSGSLELTESLRRSIADRVRFHFVRIGRIGIDLMVTNDVAAGADIHHVRGRNYDEFGIGTARLTERVGAHPPGTLVSVFIFAER